jgi:hypothetical protein
VDSLIFFTVGTLAIIVGVGYFLRGALFSVTSQAAQHASRYAIAYVKGGALIIIAMLAAFEQAFQPLTAELAARLSWWDWAILFFKPIAAGFAVLVAFLDKSAASAPPAGNTQPPFPVQ